MNNKIIFIFSILVLISINIALAANCDPGHTAAQICAGTFGEDAVDSLGASASEQGNYIFPKDLTAIGSLTTRSSLIAFGSVTANGIYSGSSITASREISGSSITATTEINTPKITATTEINTPKIKATDLLFLQIGTSLINSPNLGGGLYLGMLSPSGEGKIQSYSPGGGTYLSFYTNPTGSSSAKRMTIDHTEIKTTVPLEIVGNGAANIDLKVNGRIQTGDSSSTGGVWIGSDTSPTGKFMGALSATEIGFWNNGASRLKVDNSGYLYLDSHLDSQYLNCGRLFTSSSITGNVPGKVYCGQLPAASIEQDPIWLNQKINYVTISSLASSLITNSITINGNSNAPNILNVGGESNGHIITRHIDGKSASSSLSDNLYLNFNNNKYVVIGNDANPTEKLTVVGNIKATGDIKGNSITTSGGVARIMGKYSQDSTSNFEIDSSGISGGRLTVDTTGNLFVRGSITSSGGGSISTSGALSVGSITASDSIRVNNGGYSQDSTSNFEIDSLGIAGGRFKIDYGGNAYLKGNLKIGSDTLSCDTSKQGTLYYKNSYLWVCSCYNSVCDNKALSYITPW